MNTNTTSKTSTIDPTGAKMEPAKPATDASAPTEKKNNTVPVEPVSAQQESDAKSSTENENKTKEPRRDDNNNNHDEKESEEPSPKRLRPSEEEKETSNNPETAVPEEILDVCKQIGLNAGDRLEVEWQLEETNDQGEEKMVNKWWGCKLLPFDGRTEDGVAIRMLDYDPYPQGGFSERSQEDVVFLSHEIMISPETHAEFRYRPEGVIQFNSEEETREAINKILMDTFQKHDSTWKKLDRAQQSKIAAGIAQKKELLVDAIMSHDKSPIIGADDMKEILQGIMQKR